MVPDAPLELPDIVRIVGALNLSVCGHMHHPLRLRLLIPPSPQGLDIYHLLNSVSIGIDISFMSAPSYRLGVNFTHPWRGQKILPPASGFSAQQRQMGIQRIVKGESPTTIGVWVSSTAVIFSSRTWLTSPEELLQKIHQLIKDSTQSYIISSSCSVFNNSKHHNHSLYFLNCH